jgi:hypothetical protein
METHTTSEQSNNCVVLHFYARINFQRIGYSTLLALAFFNAQFGILHFNRPASIERQSQITAPAVQIPEKKKTSDCLKRTKKQNPRKKKSGEQKCF